MPTRSLHVHERIDPLVILDAIKKDAGKQQQSLFQDNVLPLNQAVEFYQHRESWSNRMIAGDSLLVMNSLLEKELMRGKVQTVYMDPPYGIKYGSNFQPFTNQNSAKDGSDSDLTQEPEMIKAFRDTWALEIHSYLSYMYERLLLARELLAESGSCFVQISEQNVHLVRCLMDEIFQRQNFVSLIPYRVSGGFRQEKAPKRTHDYLIWYSKNKEKMKFHRLYDKKDLNTKRFKWVEKPNGERRLMTEEERRYPERLDEELRPFCAENSSSMGVGGNREPRTFNNREWVPPAGRQWTHANRGYERFLIANRIVSEEDRIKIIYYYDDFIYQELKSIWTDTGSAVNKSYVVETSSIPISRCILMTTDPGDLVFDPTCGSGTTAYVAEQWGRRWITCDTSRVALILAKQRLMTSVFDYYKLASPEAGVGDGFAYEKARQITLGSIANNPDIKEDMTREEIRKVIEKHASLKDLETLYDKPEKRQRQAAGHRTFYDGSPAGRDCPVFE